MVRLADGIAEDVDATVAAELRPEVALPVVDDRVATLAARATADDRLPGA